MPSHLYRFMANLLFGLSGRINPAQYWFSTIVTAAVGILLYKTFGPGIGDVTLTYLSLVATMKRLHDRCKSAWWLSLYWLTPAIALGFTKGIIERPVSPTVQFAGYIIGLCALGELGLMRGTVGPNLYGPDPGGNLVPSAAPAAAGFSK